MSADKGIGIDEFKEKVWQGLGLVRVYLKRERTNDADKKEPLIIKNSSNLDDVLKRISNQMRDDVNKAYIWGKNARFPKASKTLGTSIYGALTDLLTKANTAPFEIAFSTKSCPSAFSPFSARKNEPGFALRESKTGASQTSKFPSTFNFPPTISAI